MIVNFDVFLSGMEYWIRRKVCGIDVITPKNRRLSLRDPQLCKQRMYPNEFSCGIGNCYVLTSILLRDTVACLRAFQAIMLEPKNTAYPPLDRRSSGQLAQSAFEKAESKPEGAGCRCKTIRGGETDIAQDALHSGPVGILGCMKKLADIVDCIRNFMPSDSQILKGYQRCCDTQWHP